MLHETETVGRELRITTTRKRAAMIAPIVGLFGVALGVFAFRSSASSNATIFWLLATGLVGVGLYFGLLRSGVVLDADSKRVTAWWRWLLLKGASSIDATGQPFYVERTSRRSEDQGTYYLYRICVGETVLESISEHQGGSDAAQALAQRMAEHVGSEYAGQRDCRKMRRRQALQAKYAAAPLAAVVVVLLIGALYFLFGAEL